ncbi:MAG: IS982 family transposase [Treponema sp.]|jgi:hypothetical protein|nr:IS982 family transposase [Treponema sp.]
MNELMLITLYCVIDDFIKAVMNTETGQKMLESWKASRGPQRQLCLSEVLTLNVLRFSFHIFDLKAFVRIAECSYKAYFPGLPNYENFLKASNQSFSFTVVLLQYLLELNRRMSKGGLFFFDSTALSVCANGNISTHRVTEGFASRGVTSKGWFFGFKLHGACDAHGNPVNLRFTTGSVHDSQEAEHLTGGLNGIFVGDAGYLLRKEVFARLFERHKRILAAARKNMKRLMTEEQGALLRKRNIIETMWGKLKERYGLVFHLARNMTGLFRHYCYSLASYMLEPFLFSSSLRLPDFTIGLLA